MENEFVPYEQALALKELRFDEPCMSSRDMNNGEGLIQLPLYQQAFRWFRERHDMHHGIGFTGSWYYDIDSMKNTENAVYEVAHKWNMKTYEEAESACLDELIKICKTKING